MSNTVEQYTQQLLALLPVGDLWTQLSEPDTDFFALITALAEEFARIDGRTEDLMDEDDPRTIYEMLFDWEKWLGLPDACMGNAETLQQRREAVLELLTLTGGQSRQYFIDLAKK
ncbi:hypothetical protein CDW43_15255 [Methylophaga nitratireducenticrescens]|nr:putative phage tail protein [Methylophaga nitratireducenticrescens]AUZ85838.1 hypothetical protein CDW43_15255 [Methylophaga nitratireducenticrescens]